MTWLHALWMRAFARLAASRRDGELLDPVADDDGPGNRAARRVAREPSRRDRDRLERRSVGWLSGLRHVRVSFEQSACRRDHPRKPRIGPSRRPGAFTRRPWHRPTELTACRSAGVTWSRMSDELS